MACKEPDTDPELEFAMDQASNLFAPDDEEDDNEQMDIMTDNVENKVLVLNTIFTLS